MKTLTTFFLVMFTSGLLLASAAPRKKLNLAVPAESSDEDESRLEKESTGEIQTNPHKKLEARRERGDTAPVAPEPPTLPSVQVRD